MSSTFLETVSRWTQTRSTKGSVRTNATGLRRQGATSTLVALVGKCEERVYYTVQCGEDV